MLRTTLKSVWIVLAVLMMILVYYKGVKACDMRVRKSATVLKTYSARDGSYGRENFYAIVDVDGKQAVKHISGASFNTMQVGRRYEMNFEYGYDNVPHPYFKNRHTMHFWFVAMIAVSICNFVLLIYVGCEYGGKFTKWLNKDD